MLVKVVSAQLEAVWVNPAEVAAVIVPSILAPGDGSAKIVLPGVIVSVKDTEAQKLIEACNANVDPVYSSCTSVGDF